jgi:Flp pilus assembly protein TadD
VKAGAFVLSGAKADLAHPTALTLVPILARPILSDIMTSFDKTRRRLRPMRSVMAVAFVVVPSLAAAQMVQPIPGINANDPVDTLSMHLRTLAANPRNLSALLGAGQAAIDVGDPNAALGFFARADEIDPRSGKAKAGLASALVMLEKPDDALRLFGEAVSLGVPESEVASDRGLAYDLRGDNRRAQKDYALALRRGGDDEVTRRYALSLGISGDRSQALTMLDPLLRKQDQGAWRARAFIMAMNNDVSGANAIARQVMPASLAGTMSPFLSRLGKLNAAERAHAVNFGTMPSDGQTFASVQMGDPFRPATTGGGAGDGLIPSGAPFGRQTIAMKPATPRDTGRRTGREQVAMAAVTPVPTPAAPSKSLATPGFSASAPISSATRIGTRVGTRIAAIDPAKLPPEARGEISGTRITTMTALPPPDVVRPNAAVVRPVPGPAPAPMILAPAPKPVVAAPVVATPSVQVVPVQLGTATQPPVPAPVTVTSPLPPPPPIEADAGLSAPIPGFVGPPAEALPSAPPPAPLTTTPVFEVGPRVADKPVAASQSPAPPPPPAPPVSRLASILSGIEPETESAPVVLPTVAQIRTAQRAAARKTAAAADAAAAAQLAKDEKAKQAAAAKANPARLWVQVATGSNARGLSSTWRRIREANEKLLKPYSGYSMSYKATNRVLAGPVKSSADARALVTALGKAGVSATTYSSEAGQEVVKLAAK